MLTKESSGSCAPCPLFGVQITSAGRENRTLMTLRSMDFESIASTNSAIPAISTVRHTIYEIRYTVYFPHGCPLHSGFDILGRGGPHQAKPVSAAQNLRRGRLALVGRIHPELRHSPAA